MPSFSYIAKRGDGHTVRGTINALSLDAAREELRKQSLLPEDIREQVQPKPSTTPLPWSGGNGTKSVKMLDESDAAAYAPLHETLRIFAGWLLAWYGLIYALGFLGTSGNIGPIPFIQELFASPVVLQFTFGTFLFLACSNIHRWIGGGVLKGLLLAIVYVALVTGFVFVG